MGRSAPALLHFETVCAVLQGQLLNGLGYVAFYTKLLRASDQQVGLLTAIPSLAQLLQLVIAPRTARMRRGKALVVVSGSVAGFIGATAALIPHVLPPELRLPGLIIIAGVASCVGALGQPLFNAWFANLLPEYERGRYLATRYIAQSLVVLVATWLIGRFLEVMSGTTGYAVLFALGGAVTLIGRWILWRVPDATRSGIEAGETSWHAAITVPFRYPAFMRFTRFFLVWVLAAYLSAPFQQVFLIRTLHVPLDRIGLLISVSTACTLLTYRFWGAVVDRSSNRAVYHLALIALVIANVGYLFAAPGRYAVLLAISVLGGLANSAVALTANNLFYTVYPEGDDKVTVAGFYAAVVGVAAFLGPVLGGLLAGALGGVSIHTPWIAIDRYRILFLATAGLWLAAVPLLHRVPEPNATGVRELMADLARMARGRVSNRA